MPKKRKLRAKKVKSISHGWAKPDDPIYGEPRGKGTYRGLVSDDDPIYESGWNFLMGKNLNPHVKPKKEKGPR